MHDDACNYISGIYTALKGSDYIHVTMDVCYNNHVIYMYIYALF